MKRLLYLPLIFLLACAPEKDKYENAVCFQNVNVIDAEGGLQEAMTVIVSENRIIKIGKAASISLSSDNEIIDGTGKYLIPGLWDAHVHFAYIEDLAPAMFDLFLGYGITSVRDTGGKIDFVNEWRNRAMTSPKDAPRVMIAGPLLDGMPNVYDGSTPTRPPLSVGAATVEEAIQIVKELDSIGVDLIKAYEMLTPEQLAAVAKEANARGLKVTGHIPLSMDAITASNAGMNSMEHLRNLEMSCAENADELLAERSAMLESGRNMEGSALRSQLHSAQRIIAIDNQSEERTNEVLATLASNGTWQIPTLSIMTASSKRHFTREDWKASFKYLPETVEENWVKGVQMVEERSIGEDAIKYTDWLIEMTGRVNDAEIGILAGTDCPIYFLTPGLSLHEELALLVESGLTPMEVLKSATINPAKYFDMDDELGLIKEGYIADLVLLNANPLEDIKNSAKIDAVMKDGKLRDRATLDELFSNLDK